MARDIFRNIAYWWDVKSPRVSSFEEWEMWTSSLTLSSRRKQILEGIIYIGWWSIWNSRNQVVFGSTIPSKASLFDDIVARSFQWSLLHSNHGSKRRAMAPLRPRKGARLDLHATQYTKAWA
ncbi:hypothetical protein Tco_1213620 [Tanacetum coccineum]